MSEMLELLPDYRTPSSISTPAEARFWDVIRRDYLEANEYRDFRNLLSEVAVNLAYCKKGGLFVESMNFYVDLAVNLPFFPDEMVVFDTPYTIYITPQLETTTGKAYHFTLEIAPPYKKGN